MLREYFNSSLSFLEWMLEPDLGNTFDSLGPPRILNKTNFCLPFVIFLQRHYDLCVFRVSCPMGDSRSVWIEVVSEIDQVVLQFGTGSIGRSVHAEGCVKGVKLDTKE